MLFEILSMPVKVVFSNFKVSGPLIAVLIILYAIGIIKF